MFKLLSAVLSNAINGAQEVKGDATVEGDARFVFADTPSPAAIVIPQFQDPGAGRTVTRTVTIANIGKEVVDVNYDGGTIDGQRVVQIVPGTSTTFTSVPRTKPGLLPALISVAHN